MAASGAGRRRAATAIIATALVVFCASCASAPSTALAKEWYEIGNAWLDKGEWKRAGEAYSHALSLDPKLAGVSFNLARALAEAGDYRRSLAIIERLLAEDPENVRLLASRAYVLYKKGDAKAAMAAYDEVLRLDPYAPDAVYNSALLREAAGDKEGAAADLERFLSAKPDDVQALLLFAKVEEELGNRDAAITAYEKAEALGKADGAALERLGLLYDRERRYAEAMDTLAAATKAEPKRSGAWFALARLRLAVAEDGPGGLEALRQALDSGFTDKDAIAQLLAEPVLAEREAVVALLKGHHLAD